MPEPVQGAEGIGGKSMIKPGIWKLAQYSACPPWLRRRLRVSYTLLRHAQAESRAAELFENVIRDLQLSSGVCRTTYRGRFVGLDEKVNRYLGEIFPSSALLTVHDWAASDCLTAGEWAVALLARFPHLDFHASDQMFYLIEIHTPSGETVVVEPDGTPLQHIRPPFVTSYLHRDATMFLVNRWIRERAERMAAWIRESVPSTVLRAVGEGGPLRLSNWTLESISLVHPEFRQLLHTETRTHLLQHSVFEPLATPAQVIRTMNIFNPDYFSEPVLERGYRAVQASLAEGGVWIVGTTRTTDGFTDASVFRKINGHFQFAWRAANGYPLESRVLALAQTP